MFHARFFLSLGICLFFLCPSLAQNDDEPSSNLPSMKPETVVVTANRNETPLREVGSSVTVITAEDMQRDGHFHVIDALRDVAGLDVVRTGGPGTITSIFMRGANAGHTLVIVDGVEMQDPISAGNSFNMTHFTMDNVDRVEIVRGPQSTLYGSDSIGGVIQIFTKRGSGVPSGDLQLEGGSYGQQRIAASTRAGNERYYVSAAGSYQDFEGFSAANERLGNLEEDGYRNASFSAQLGAKPADNWDLSLNARYIDAVTDIDNGGGVGQDDPNYVSESTQTALALSANVSLLEGRWDQQFGVSFMQQDRVLNNGVDAAHPIDRSTGDFEGIKTKIHWQNTFLIGQRHQIVFGAETENEEGESFFESDGAFGPFVSEFREQDARTTGLFLQDQWQLNARFHLTLGARFDDHDRFGSRTTYRAAAAYQLNERGSIVRGSYGTGFKAPSLFQLYSSFGNLALDPEKSEGLDLGFEHRFHDSGFQLGVTLFRNDFETLIDFDFATFLYGNISEAKSEGVELHFEWQGDSPWYGSLTGTMQSTEDGSTGESLFRRPDEKAQVRIGYRFREAGYVQLAGRYVGPREFNDFSSETGRTTLGGYSVFGLVSSWRLVDDFHLNVRFENIFDKVYEEVLGYGVSEAAGYLGLRLNY